MAELPQNWIEIKLKHLIKFVIGGDWGTEKPSISNSERVAVIRGTDYKYWNKIRAKEAAIRYVKKSSLEKRQLNIGDIVLEISGGGPTQPVARTIVIDKYAIESNKCNLICSNFFRKISLKPSINPAYLNFYCQYAHKIGLFNDFQTQTTNLRNLNFNDFINNVFIPIPPENEQFKIINKLDKIISKIDYVNTRIDKIPTALKRARQSILSQAITGELTKDWRKKNAYSSAKELISKLEIEKNNIYAKECEIAKSNETKKPQKPKYFRIANNVLDINIPNQWSFINLSQTIYDFKYGTSTKSDYSYKGIPVIRIPNISNMKLSFDDLKYLNLSDIDSSNKIKKDDILIVRSNGSRDLVGKNALVKELDKEYAFASYLIRMRPLINNPEYLILLLNTDAIKEQFFSKAKSSAGINNINTEELATTIIPLPPLEEQAEIVRRVKLAFEKLDKIELRYQKAKEYSDKLTQSILNKAFRGELVPQDPNDKPVEIEV